MNIPISHRYPHRFTQEIACTLLLFTPVLFLFVGFASTPAYSGIVRSITVDAAINPATADYIHDAIQRAAEDHAECLVIRLNTPGGLLQSTRDIVSDFLTSPVPIIVYVSPAGAQAASAGVFITLASNIAVMAPGTNIGAAHPVTTGEQTTDSIMMGKITNDAAAFIRTISEKRNRNITGAESAVRKSLSLTETEAVAQHVVDTIAPNLTQLLRLVDGKTVTTSGGKVTLHTADAKVEELEKSSQQKILDILSDPNIAYIFMMLGFYGLLFELYNPGSVLPGIVGVISLVIAFYSLHTLPVNYAGLALILFSVVLFVLDIKLPSHGLLTAGGIISLTLGSIMLFRTEASFDAVSISWQVIAIVVVLTTAFFVFVVGVGLRAQRKKPTTGKEGMLGEPGEAITDLTPGGKVKIHGEIWNAVSLDGTLPRGTPVRSVEMEDLTLKVRKLEI
ncbi:MAG TPA: nodulation protein NfeD [Bacteroidota bacterium]|nr:nodulation protein NfeD [Bacteroidota bacterium]